MMYNYLFVMLLPLAITRPSRKGNYGELEHQSIEDLGKTGSWLDLIDVINAGTSPQTSTIQEKSGPQLHEKFCGSRPLLGEMPTTRIIGGEDADPGEFPWQVSLARMSSGRPHLICGGTLISSRSVLTASHCLKLSASNYQVWLGKMSSLLDVEECHQQKFVVMKYFKHPDFNPTTLRNDVAIVSILSPYGQGARWTDWVLPACLPSSQHADLYKEGLKGQVSGWGLLDEEDTAMASKLQHVTVPIIRQDRCEESYSGLTSLHESQICAGLSGGGKDACAGDSGGPFVVRDSVTRRYYVTGVVSFGYGCGRGAYPGVYTRVEKFIPWVLEQVVKIEGGSSMVQYSDVTRRTTATTATPMTRRTTTTTKRTTMSTTRRTTRRTTEKTRRTSSATKMHKAGPVCQGYYRYLKCNFGTLIKVREAFFGRKRNNLKDCPISYYRRGRGNCALRSAKRDLARACDGKRSCQVNTRTKPEGVLTRNPCSKQRPFVSVEYECVKPSGSRATGRAFDFEYDDYSSDVAGKED
eukprot:GFUD01031447.1.p1 GENE.GFUD01031447.1~~GFUD01031447.1.p1  ORF type:complete len:524 (-),score=108.55 GFUD01031447.1:89-1660(-)